MQLHERVVCGWAGLVEVAACLSWDFSRQHGAYLGLVLLRVHDGVQELPRAIARVDDILIEPLLQRQLLFTVELRPWMFTT